jgi:Zn-dependent M28 family amino/carboxypeptidase
VVILLLALLLQSPVADPPKELVESITSENVFKHISELSADTYEGREAGTSGCDKAALYIETRLKEWKLAPAGPKGSYFQTFKARGKPTRNVLGVILGSDPALKKEFVLVGAHYDHIGLARGGDDAVNNGADDNASGTAAALEIARAFASLKERPARSLLFGWWSAEEMGLLGSKFFVDNPTVDLKSIVACLNMDMVGRNAEDSIDIEGTGCSPDLKALFERINERKIFARLNFEQERVLNDTDHFWFYKSGIPAVEFFSGYHADYHKPGDEAEKITKAKLERVGRFVALAAWDLANSKSRPAFKKMK